jgi:phytoene dehydrogenase-like protein
MEARVNRRDLLVALLGASFTGCARRTPPLPPGELVGADLALGHRLREPLRRSPSRWETVPLLIVGGGVAGLSAGWHLQRRGFRDFRIVELESVLGGTSRSGTDPIPHPWGAHYLPAPVADNTELLTLLREMGAVEGTDPHTGDPLFAEHILCRDPHERLFARGQWHEGLWLSAGANADDEAQRNRFFAEVSRWIAYRDGQKRRAFTLPSRLGSTDRDVLDLDRLSMADWLRERGFTSPRLWWQIDYACRDDYGAHPADVSAWAGLFYFASRKGDAEAESQPLLTWPEGNGRLIAHLARGQRSETGWAVADVNALPEGAEVLAVNAQGECRGWRARAVIFAGPRFVAQRVIRGLPPTELPFTYGAWMVANLHLRERPREPGVPLCWDNVLYDSPSLGYVVATHQQGVDHGPTLWTYYYPLCDSDAPTARTRLYQYGRDEWAEVALADLERAHPELRTLVTRIDVMRWGHAMIRPTVGFFRTRHQVPMRHGCVWLAHSDSTGLPLFEEAFDSGLRAAEGALASLRRI